MISIGATLIQYEIPVVVCCVNCQYVINIFTVNQIVWVWVCLHFGQLKLEPKVRYLCIFSISKVALDLLSFMRNRAQVIVLLR
jgi:hypothetical protein